MNNIMKNFLIIILIIFICFNLLSAEKFLDLMNSRWLVIGPFENPQVDGFCKGFDKDLLAGIGGETNLKFEQNQKINGLQWQNYQSNSDKLDFMKIVGQYSNCLAYAYNEFILYSEQKAILKIGSDDGIKIWLNGIQIFTHHIHRSNNPDSDLVMVNLKKGANKILVKVDQGDGSWSCTLRLKTIEDEIADFNKTKINGLKLIISENLVLNNEIDGIVLPDPSFYINENVKVALYDINNKKLSEKNVPIGQNFKFDVKNYKSNLFYLKSFGSGKLSGLQSEQEIIIVGDLKKIKDKYIKLASDIAKSDKLPECNFDIRATCNFFKEQFEGKMDSSLISLERQLRAIYTLNEINQFIENPKNKITGLRQRAYYSSIDQSYQPYSIYIPSSYDKNRKYSLLICLHGFSGNDYNGAKNVADCKPADFIIVGAFGRGDVGYYGIGEQDVLDVMEIVKKNFNIDDNRVYLTGWSMGGLGTWRLGQLYSDKFAAIASFCGWTWDTYLDNLINLPVLIVHGTDDTVVPIDMDTNAVNNLKSLGYNVRFDIVQKADHDVWSAWIKDSDPNKLLDYFRKIKRNPDPIIINIHNKNIRFGKQYWAKIIEFNDPTNNGLLKAKIIDDRHIKVSLENIKTFEVNLQHPTLAKNGRIVLNINGNNVLVDAGNKNALIGYSSVKKVYQSLKNENNSIASHEGGGLVDLFMKKLIIIYGTKKKNTIKKWQNIAGILSDLSIKNEINIGTKIGKYKIISDKELITLMDSKDNLIKDANFLLLGSYDENRVIEKISSSLPLKFNGDDIELLKEKYKKSGLFFVYPNPLDKKTLVGIISLPFNDNKLYDFITNLNMKLRMYFMPRDIIGYSLPDIVIFKSYDYTYATGYFNYNWKELYINKNN